MTEFVCGVEKEHNKYIAPKYLSACKNMPEYPDTGYCVLHYPGKCTEEVFKRALTDKKEEFEKAVANKLDQKDYDFGGTIFPEGTSDFQGFEFDASANFFGAVFIGEVDFTGAEFSGQTTDFSSAKFSGQTTDFSSVKFRGRTTKFSSAEFGGFGAKFTGAEFSGWETYFSGAKFSGMLTSFTGAKFSGGRKDFSGAKFSSEATFFSEAEFSGGWTFFNGAKFSGERTDFSRAEISEKTTDFSNAKFDSETTDFRAVPFSGEWTDFSRAEFSGERTDFTREVWFNAETTDFSSTEFTSRETDFSSAYFNGGKTDFSNAKFSGAETFFHKASLRGNVDFCGATFGEKVDFRGTNGNRVFSSRTWVRFEHSLIAKPEQFTFNTVLLHPGWFINADVRKVDFTDVQWYGLSHEIVTLKERARVATDALKITQRAKEATDALKKRELNEAWEALKKLGLKQGWYELTTSALDKAIEELEARVSSPNTLLAQACRRLSANAEENNEYPLANEFRYWSMDALRKENWTRVGLVGTLYWALSGYGVRAGRALGVLLTMAVAFAVLYMTIGHPSLRMFPIVGIWQVLADAGRAVMYSLGVMARLRPEPIPQEMGLFQILVTVEGILGPLQIALLALAVRRKVMR